MPLSNGWNGRLPGRAIKSAILDVLEHEIGEREFLAGPTPTIADFTVFPIFQTARERFDHPMGVDHPRLDGWFRNFRRRPSADY